MKSNVTFRVAEKKDADLFEIDSQSGWIKTKRPLGNMGTNELRVVAENRETQRTASVKVRVAVECGVSKLSKAPSSLPIKRFTLFESMPNDTHVGSFASVCSDQGFFYGLSDEESAELRVCERRELDIHERRMKLKERCERFSLRNIDLFRLERNGGHLVTNQVD